MSSASESMHFIDSDVKVKGSLGLFRIVGFNPIRPNAPFLKQRFGNVLLTSSKDS
jgi:hypothetical protein